MQQNVHNRYSGTDSLRDPLHLGTVSNQDLFNPEMVPTSESDDSNSVSDDFNIQFYQNHCQDFGLGYWMNRTNHNHHESQLHNESADHLAFISKPNTYICTNRSNKSNDFFCDNVEKSKNNQNSKSTNYNKKPKEKKSKSSKLNSSNFNHNIPCLKIPKGVIKKYFRTLPAVEQLPSPPTPPSSSLLSSSSCCSSSSSSSDSESPNKQIYKGYHNISVNQSNSSNTAILNPPLSDHHDSKCLQKSFFSSKYSKPKSVYQLVASSHNKMLLSMTIKKNLVFDLSSLSVIMKKNNNNKILNSCETSNSVQCRHERDNNFRNGMNESDECESNGEETGDLINSNDQIKEIDQPNYLSLAEQRKCLSTNFDSRRAMENVKDDKKTDLKEFGFDNCFSTVNNNRKRLYSENAKNASNDVKKQVVEINTKINSEKEDQKVSCDMTALKYVRLFMNKMKCFEKKMYEKYCLSQPNAMKFLADNHALKWESYKTNSDQLHFVPCGLIAEILHRALYCYGLEKRTLKETLNVNSSSLSQSIDPFHCAEYKKVRDEYSFSIKRVRYSNSVIDDLFKRKFNFKTIKPNSDLTIVRKWKYLMYYLCLQAKAVFMTKEMQYNNYSSYVTSSGAFDGDCTILCNTTPSARNSVVDTHIRVQCSKDNPRALESKLIKTLSPEHLCQFDVDISPHSSDSGKGSSIRFSSNRNGQVSGSHTTSSLNSTPHSVNDSQLNLPGFHMYQIDEYLKAANEFIQFLPETLQLHKQIISKIILEPNANSSDNMVRFINYTETCQEMCEEDALSKCLQRLVSQSDQM